MHKTIIEAGYQVVGVSPQREVSHRQFSELHGLPFPLLADPRKSAIRAYGVDGPLGFGVRRVTFIINTDGVIEGRHVADFDVGSHARFIKASLG